MPDRLFPPVEVLPPEPEPARSGLLAPLGRAEGAPLAQTLPRPSAPPVDPATAFLTRFTSANSRRSMAASLRVLGLHLTGRPVTDPRAVPWAAIRYTHAQELRARLAAQYATASANRHLNALRGIVRECWQLGIISQEEYLRLAQVKLLRHSAPDTGRALKPAEVDALYASCDQSEQGRRDAAILALALGAGLRRSEVCALDATHYDATEGKLSVLGKGNKWRNLYPSPNVREVLESWLAVRGRLPGPFVCPCDKSGRVQRGKALSDQGVYAITQAIGRRAKVAQFRPHDLRRTFITRLLEKGGDALTVSKLAGHESVQTTMRYDKRGEAAKKQVMALLDD